MDLAAPERGWLQRGKEFFFPPPVATPADLRDFLAGEAAYLAQKSVIGYCRVKTMLAFDKLMKEQLFIELLNTCRWEAYSRTLADTMIMADGWLRQQDPASGEAISAGLARLYRDILTESLPAHRQDWADRLAEFDTRFAQSRMAAPLPPEQLIQGTASLIHDLAPIHTKLKRNDLEVIAGDLGFNIVALHAAMRKRFRAPALIAALKAAPAA